jgi:hypothetical protein
MRIVDFSILLLLKEVTNPEIIAWPYKPYIVIDKRRRSTFMLHRHHGSAGMISGEVLAVI